MAEFLEKNREMKGERPELTELQERVEKLEGGAPIEREKTIKREIKDYLQELQQATPAPTPLADRDEAKEIRQFPPSQQVGALISLVFEKGLKEAIAVARDMDNPAIMDELHDILVDRYYQELIGRKMLKP